MSGAILVTGGSGQVGTALAERARATGHRLVLPDSTALNLSDPDAITAWVARESWAAIINCAAYTGVDKAESEPDRAFAINADAPRTLAQAAAQAGIRVLHVSTDYVFDGSKLHPYDEEDPTAPLGIYGQSKEAGEAAVRAANPDHVILRTAWVVSPWGNNFVKTMLRLGKERDELRVVADQLGCPTSAIDIADALLTMVDRFRPGTYHFVNGGEASWHALAQHVFDRAATHGLRAPKVVPITTADYPTPAQRPANSRLSTAKIAQDFSIAPRDWKIAIDEIVDRLVTS